MKKVTNIFFYTFFLRDKNVNIGLLFSLNADVMSKSSHYLVIDLPLSPNMEPDLLNYVTEILKNGKI